MWVGPVTLRGLIDLKVNSLIAVGVQILETVFALHSSLQTENNQNDDLPLINCEDLGLERNTHSKVLQSIILSPSHLSHILSKID